MNEEEILKIKELLNDIKIYAVMLGMAAGGICGIIAILIITWIFSF